MATETTIVGNATGDTIPGAPLVVDWSQFAGRVSIRPLEWKGSGRVLGHYRLTAISGTIAASLAGASILFAARWGDASNRMVLTRLSASLGVYTAAQTVANPLDLEAVMARSWTADYGANNANIVPAAGAQKARTETMASSLFGSSGKIQILTTTGMTGATNVLDTAGFGYAMYPGNALGVADTKDLYRWLSLGEHPPIFNINEGFVIRNPGAFGAAATYKLGVVMDWAEVPSF